ncbi:MAG TPA: MerR family transcriptional regulator [Ktedonobacteraceae bacterium]|nr:MerR family transcriptional regulator [Ktedonobacteraceae bacterium]
MKGLYTAKEAREKLGVTDDKFQYMVRTGLIKKVILPGRKYGMYPQAEVNRLAAAINATLEQYTKDTSIFEQATQADLPEIIAMCSKNMPRVTPIEKQRGWLKRNPESFYTLRENGEVVAYACIFPVNFTWLKRVLKDEIRMGDVPIEEIYPFTPDKSLDLYIRDLIVDQTVGKEAAAHHAQRLLSELAHVITQLGKRGTNIRAIYALATSPQGNQLARKLGFRAMTELDNPTEGYMPYELIVDKSDSPLINEYKAELQHHEKQTSKKR